MRCTRGFRACTFVGSGHTLPDQKRASARFCRATCRSRPERMCATSKSASYGESSSPITDEVLHSHAEQKASTEAVTEPRDAKLKVVTTEDIKPSSRRSRLAGDGEFIRFFKNVLRTILVSLLLCAVDVVLALSALTAGSVLAATDLFGISLGARTFASGTGAAAQAVCTLVAAEASTAWKKLKKLFAVRRTR